jgi:predicted MFS family arabinose efflux permease
VVRFDKPFWVFLFSENFYDFGLYTFALLYNLYLLDLGYREDLLGWVASVGTLGNIAGAVPAAFITRRFGLRRTLIFGSAGVATLCAIRVIVPGRPALLASAFVAGMISAVWAVSLVPVVAALTARENRPQGYSLWTGWGVGLGVICGPLAGALPGRILKSGLAATNQGAKRVALLGGAVVAFLAPWLLVRLPLNEEPRDDPRVFPSSPFVKRYVAAYAVWNLAIGIFNPFFSAYFSRQLGMPVARIGVVFAGGQLATVAGLFAAPAVLRRAGSVRGIALIQLGMALALMLLATGPSPLAAAALYAAYMAFQVMMEPGAFTLLMEGVKPGERGGASALNFFAMNAPQSAAAAAAGMAVTRFGYRPVLLCAAAIAALAAWLFRRLLVGAVQSG